MTSLISSHNSRLISQGNEVSFDLLAGSVTVAGQSYPLTSEEGFAIAANVWLRATWDAKYVYTFSWLGRPVIQLPDDLLRIQELIFEVQPDFIIETGVAHGGSLVFYATLCKALGRGHVIGIDIDIRPQNRSAIEGHPLSDFITLLEGSSTDPCIVKNVKDMVSASDASCLVVLDSCHTKEHVLNELAAYAPLVSIGSYIIAMDGIMQDVAGAPRTSDGWLLDNPREAARTFAIANPKFLLCEPRPPFSEGIGHQVVSYSRGGHLKRIR